MPLCRITSKTFKYKRMETGRRVVYSLGDVVKLTTEELVRIREHVETLSEAVAVRRAPGPDERPLTVGKPPLPTAPPNRVWSRSPFRRAESGDEPT